MPRSSSITTTCSRANPNAIARSTSAYWRSVDSTLRSSCAWVDWRTYTNAARRRCDAESFERSLMASLLLPGDRLFIPDKQFKKEACATAKKHRFQIKEQRVMLRVVLLRTPKTPG